MKLLFDENISPRMVELISDLHPNSSHVREHRLQKKDDEVIWSFAKEQGFVIVSKDFDFQQRSLLYGFPPKVIWLRTGNCTTSDLQKILRSFRDEIWEFYEDEEASFLVIP